MSAPRVFRLEVRLEGADFEAKAWPWTAAAARVLRETASRLEHVPGRPETVAFILRDINGHSCGGAWVSVEPVERLAFKRSARAGGRITADG